MKIEEDRTRGMNYPVHLRRLLEGLQKLEYRIDTALAGTDLICEEGIKTIDRIAKITDKLNELVEQTSEAFKKLPQGTAIDKVLM